jgi:protein TonB
MANTHPQMDPASAQHVHDPAYVAPRPRTSPVLVGALAVALVALGVWWFQQRDTAPQGGADGVGVPMSQVETPAGATASGMAEPVVRSTPTQPRQAQPAAAERAPRPLASNRIPSYPVEALRSGVEGQVVLAMSVDQNGVPSEIEVVERSGERALDRAALQAARNWRFEPALRDGQPVTAQVTVPVDFRRD